MRGKPMPVLFLTVFLDLLGFGMIIPLLPFIAERTGASPFEVTLLMAGYSLMQFAFAPLWGRLSDRVGRRPVLLASIGGSIIALVLFALSQSYAMLLVARLVHGAMNANIAVAQAAIADITTPETRAKGMGLFGAAFGLGFVFGPAMGGILGHHGLQTAALAAAALALVNLASAIILLPETRPPGARGQPGPKPWRPFDRSLLRGASRERLRALLLTSYLVTVGFSAMESVFSLWTERSRGWGALENGLVFAYVGVILVVTQGLLIGRLRKRYAESTLALGGLGGLVVGLWLLPLASTLALLLLAVGLLALSNGVLQPNLSALVSHEAAPGETGSVLGAAQSANALARVVGPLVAGAAFTFLAPGAPFLIGGALVAGAIAALHRPRAGSAGAAAPTDDGV